MALPRITAGLNQSLLYLFLARSKILLGSVYHVQTCKAGYVFMFLSRGKYYNVITCGDKPVYKLSWVFELTSPMQICKSIKKCSRPKKWSCRKAYNNIDIMLNRLKLMGRFFETVVGKLILHKRAWGISSILRFSIDCKILLYEIDIKSKILDCRNIKL